MCMIDGGAEDAEFASCSSGRPVSMGDKGGTGLFGYLGNRFRFPKRDQTFDRRSNPPRR